ncbi:MAG: hypothetical protein ABIY52_14305 [Gemmatimonadaceae bacterium]
MRSVLLASLGLLVATAMCSAQSQTHEYRAEVIITLPRIRGFGLLMVMDQRLAMSDLTQDEINIGSGIISPQFHRMSAAFEARQVKTVSGSVEHRYIPTFYFNLPLPGGFEVRDRNRFEMRDIAGTWSQRYINRTAIGHTIGVLDWTTFPFVQSDAYYDVKSSRFNRLDGTVGTRTPLFPGSSIDTFLTRSSDQGKTPRVGITLGALLRVQL